MSCWFWRSYYLTDTSEFRPPSLVRCWFIKIIQNTISNSLFDRSWDLRGFSTFTSFEHKGKPHFILWSVFLWKIISNPNISFMPDVTFEYKRNNFDRSELWRSFLPWNIRHKPPNQTSVTHKQTNIWTSRAAVAAKNQSTSLQSVCVEKQNQK